MATSGKAVLLTAFEPFGGRKVNRSQLVLEHVARAAAARVAPGRPRVVTRVLPVSFDALGPAVARALRTGRGRPAAVVMLGEAGTAEELRLERVAVNRIDARIPDNAGKRPTGERVVEGGPAAYFSSAPLKRAQAAARKAGVPVRLSDDAGGFACNAAYYLALHRLHQAGAGELPVLFVHVPVQGKAVELRAAARAVLAILDALAEPARTRGGKPTPRTPARRPAGTAAVPK